MNKWILFISQSYCQKEANRRRRQPLSPRPLTPSSLIVAMLEVTGTLLAYLPNASSPSSASSDANISYSTLAYNSQSDCCKTQSRGECKCKCALLTHSFASHCFSLPLSLKWVALLVHQELAHVQVCIEENFRQLAIFHILPPGIQVKMQCTSSYGAANVMCIGLAGFTMSSEMHRLSAKERLSTHRSSNRST